jgi:hypothetical protein
MITFGTIAFVAAQYDYYPTLQYIPGKYIVVWYFQTTDPYLGPFDGRTIIRSSVVASADVGGVYTPVKPLLIITTENYVFLFFWNATLPKTAEGGAVTGALTTGETFDASGPGWTWGGVHGI